MKPVIIFLILFSLGCVHKPKTLYNRIGGETSIQKITDNFIDQIGNDDVIFKYFEKSNVDRFRQSFAIHLCMSTGGPCNYIGDNMQEIHRGMMINEGDFNRTVDLLINAMRKSGLTHRESNRVIARLIPHHKNIVYK